MAHGSPIDPERAAEPKIHVSQDRVLIIGYALGRLRQQAGGFFNLVQMHNLINKALKHMYGIDFNFTFEEVTEVFRMLQENGLAKFRTRKDWERPKEQEEKKKDGSASQGIPR